MSVEIREHQLGGNLRPFLDVVDHIYADDPAYVRPLDMDLKKRLSRKNPFFEHGEGTIFTAHRGNTCVGRCTAQIDSLHVQRYQEDVGFFGFLDTENDPEIAKALIDASRKWLGARGMKRIRGPVSLSINEELGCLIDGFDTPPMIMMPHHRAYQGGLIEQAGLEKKKDVYAWKYVIGDVAERAMQALLDVQAMPEVVTRQVSRKHIERDVRIVMDIFNDAWSQNWGFVPLTESELTHLANDLKLLMDPAMTFITEVEGEPAAMCLALPNVNEAIRDFHGKLGPVQVAKLLWRLKVKRPKTARLALLGIRKKFRRRKYGALSFFLYANIHKATQRRGVEFGELSWTLEDNFPVNVGIKYMGGTIYKTYRVYESAL